MPGEQGSYDERRVQKLDIVDRPIDEVVDVFKRYLTYVQVSSGQALKSARADYENLAKRKIAVQTIAVAWRDLASEPDSLLMDLISEKVESLCGYRPGPEDVEEFLIELANGEPQKPVALTEKMKIAQAPPASERNISYRIFGQSRQASNAIDALLDILRTLASRNPNFIERLVPFKYGGLVITPSHSPSRC